MVPRGMLGGSGERGDHDEAIAISGVHQWLRNRPTTSGASHRQEQHGHIGELPAYLPLIRTEFTNHALIEIMQFRHSSSYGLTFAVHIFLQSWTRYQCARSQTSTGMEVIA